MIIIIITDTREKDYIDGLVISDGSIRLPKRNKNPTYCQKMALRYKEWGDKIVDNLNLFGYSSRLCESVRKAHTIKGYYYPDTKVIECYTKTNSKLHYYRERWYEDGSKVIPKDINMSDQFLANWYMGDGSVHIQKSTVKNKQYKYWYITLCVNSFNKEDVEFLREKLVELGYYFTISNCKDGFRLHLCRQKDVMKFLENTHKYSVCCFGYKWRPLNDHL